MTKTLAIVLWGVVFFPATTIASAETSTALGLAEEFPRIVRTRLRG